MTGREVRLYPETRLTVSRPTVEGVSDGRVASLRIPGWPPVELTEAHTASLLRALAVRLVGREDAVRLLPDVLLPDDDEEV